MSTEPNDVSQNIISLAQLAEGLTRDRPEQKEDVQLNLLARLEGGNFNFPGVGNKPSPLGGIALASN